MSEVRPSMSRRFSVRVAAGLCLAWMTAVGSVAVAATAGAERAGSPVSAADGATVAGPVEGVWERHEMVFRYVGLTSFYACDVLAAKVGRLLEYVGARPGAEARVAGCDGGFDRISRFPSVRLVFHTLVPAADVPPPQPPKPEAPARRLGRDVPPLKPATAPEPGVGAWRTVEFAARSPRWIEAGDCELLEQFARDVLPKFRTRGLDDRVRCAPGQVSGADVRLRVEVLGALPEADAPAGR
ncbi:MAG: hypothetical protein ACK53C_04070 [Pseudomonadota bacterium]